MIQPSSRLFYPANSNLSNTVFRCLESRESNWVSERLYQCHAIESSKPLHHPSQGQQSCSHEQGGSRPHYTLSRKADGPIPVRQNNCGDHQIIVDAPLAWGSLRELVRQHSFA